MIVGWLFLAVPLVCLQFVIVVVSSSYSLTIFIHVNFSIEIKTVK